MANIAKAWESLQYAQARMCESADAKRHAEAFQVGEFALLSTKEQTKHAYHELDPSLRWHCCTCIIGFQVAE